MILNTAMLMRLTHRAFRGAWVDFTTMAQGHKVLHQAETRQFPPAIFAEDAIDRIDQLSPWCNWETEMRTVKGGVAEHAATETFTFEDVEISGPFLYKGAAKARHGFGPERLIRRERADFQDLDAVHLVTNWPGSEFFGQYLRDLFPLEIIPGEDVQKISLTTRSYTHAKGYRDLLGLKPAPEVARGRAKHLTIYRDFSQNSFKVARYRELRARLREQVLDAPDRSAGVYIRRGATGERRILSNEAEVEAHVAELGFDIVVPAELDAKEIARRTRDARIVISVEGSHLGHSIFTIADDGAFLVLQPPDRFAMTYKEFADCLDLRFAFIVGTQVEGGFTIDPGEIEQMIEFLK